MTDELEFMEAGPFDREERATIQEVHAAIREVDGDGAYVDLLRRSISRIEQLADVLDKYPSIFTEQNLGKRSRDRWSLVNLLSRSNMSTFEMSLPTRALLGRTLIMAEMNFYRLLRFLCREALGVERASELVTQIDRHLCQCIYTRLAELLLSYIASDAQVATEKRKKAVLALSHIWERVSYRISDYLPVLQATWEARRRIAVCGGTLLGTSEIFQLVQAGCDSRFVDFLVSEEHTEDEAAAFREFLFGTTTEQLERLEAGMTGKGGEVVDLQDLSTLSRRAQSGEMGVDPAFAMFEFFLSRHLQARARRQADLPGPKRTAEGYVMLRFLETQNEEELSALPI